MGQFHPPSAILIFSKTQKALLAGNLTVVCLELEFLNNLWGLGEPSRNRVVVPAGQATQPGGIGSLESIL
jgi:hypothetical protein